MIIYFQKSLNFLDKENTHTEKFNKSFNNYCSSPLFLLMVRVYNYCLSPRFLLMVRVFKPVALKISIWPILFQISDAKITINEPKPGAAETVIIISGTPEQTHAAQSLIQAFVMSEKDST